MSCRTCAPECLQCGNRIEGTPQQSAGAWSLCSSCASIGYRMVKVGRHWMLRLPDGRAPQRCQEVEYRRRMAG